MIEWAVFADSLRLTATTPLSFRVTRRTVVRTAVPEKNPYVLVACRSQNVIMWGRQYWQPHTA